MEESLQDAIMCPGCGGVVLRHERVHDHNTLFRWVTIDDFDGGMQDAIDTCLAVKEFPCPGQEMGSSSHDKWYASNEDLP